MGEPPEVPPRRNTGPRYRALWKHSDVWSVCLLDWFMTTYYKQHINQHNN